MIVPLGVVNEIRRLLAVAEIQSVALDYLPGRLDGMLAACSSLSGPELWLKSRVHCHRIRVV